MEIDDMVLIDTDQGFMYSIRQQTRITRLRVYALDLWLLGLDYM